MKKYILNTILFFFIVALSCFVGLAIFMGYGGNNCDRDGKLCDCFCCNLFGLRGYEACGNFGLLFGALGGAIVGGLVIFLIYKYGAGKNTKTSGQN